MSKITDIKERYPEMTIDLVDIFAKHDPSSTKKYLEYMVKISSDHTKSEEFIGGIEKCFEDVFELIQKFDSFIDSPCINNKDIYSYKDVNKLVKIVEDAEKNKTERYIKDKETIQLYRDDNFNVVIPLTHESSLLYGSSTKWCTASKDSSSQFTKHYSEGVLIYVINKKSTVPDKYKKVAWFVQGKNGLFKYDTNVTIWDSTDAQVKGFTETFDLMNNYLEKAVRDKLMTIISTVENLGYTISKNSEALKKI